MKTVLIATGNKGKLKEMQSFFRGVEGIKWVTLSDLSPIEEPEETGATYAENAELKAQFYAAQTGLPTLAEDSGLMLGAFPKKFGVRTRREIAAKTDVEWLEKFLVLLQDEPNRAATFSSCMSFYVPAANARKTILGQTVGTLTEFPMAPLEKGIPVSAVFVPEGFDVVYSAMTTAQKNQCSHRGKAAKEMAAHLNKWATDALA